jgi:hypothetical protein
MAAVPNTPALQALANQIAEAAPAAPTKARSRTPEMERQAKWRDELRANGGKMATVALSPEAVKALDSITEGSLLAGMSQTALISTAILRLLGNDQGVLLDPEARAAVDGIKTDWGIDNDAEAVSVALRAFRKLCVKHRVTELVL